MQTEVVRSPKLGYVVDFAQLIGRLTRIKKSAIQKPKHCLTWDYALLLITYSAWQFRGRNALSGFTLLVYLP